MLSFYGIIFGKVIMDCYHFFDEVKEFEGILMRE